MSSSSNSFIIKNWQIILWFVIAVFTAGGVFSEFTSWTGYDIGEWNPTPSTGFRCARTVVIDN